MPVYLIVTFDITDAAGYAEYVAGVLPLLRQHGAELLVADSAVEAWEGRAPGRAVLLKFPSAQAARNWYNDPAYAPVKQLRLNATRNGQVLLADQFVPRQA